MGKHTRGRRGGTREAIRRLDAARTELSAARAQLAAASIVGQAPAFTHPACAILAAHRARLLASPGVVGVGLGVRAAKPVISVFTGRQDGRREASELGIAEVARARFATGISIDIDVIPFGDLARPPRPVEAAQARVDVRLEREEASSSLAPGDGVGQVSPATRGTLGSFAIDRNRNTVGITAMHVIDDVSGIDPDDPAIPLVQRDDLNSPGRNIGAIDRGTRRTVDAARVRLADGVAPRWDIPSIGDVRGWRWACNADLGQGARIYGARSRRLDGEITQIEASFAFPSVTFERALVVSIATSEGDSGAALVDSDGYVLGFLAGASNLLDSSLRIFSSAGLVLQCLDCNIP
jgi:hypothetical protein